jgi:hypothetical protein
MSEASRAPTPLAACRGWTQQTFRKEAYAALKRAITAMDSYDHALEICLP